VKDQSHKDEMSAAIRGDFQRLRDRGVAATLAPRDEEDAPELLEIAAEPEEPVVAIVETVVAEPDAEPAASEDDEPSEDDRPGFLTRLFGR
jgi:hypothetical protein